MSTIDDDGSSTPVAPVHVSWQTVFWILVALATAAMTQPAGRVCDLPSRHRTYLRSSPIVCLADAAAVLLTFGFAVLCHGVAPRVCLEALIWRRYYDDDDDDDDDDEFAGSSESVQALEAMTLVRWAFFVLCSLPPAVKLLFMAGLPWSRAYGVMFLVSFVGVEGLAFVKRREDAADGSASPRRRPDSSLLDLTSGQVEVINRVVLAVALMVHISLLLWALFDIWPTPSDGLDPLLVPHLLERLFLEALMLFLILFFAYAQTFLVLVVIIGVPAGVVSYLDRRRLYFRDESRASKLFLLFLEFVVEKFGWAWIGTPTFLAFFGLSWKLYSLETVFLKWICIDYGLVTGVIAGPAVMTLAVYKVSKRWKGVGRKLLVVMEGTDRVDTWACCGLVFFLTNLTVCTVWYSYGYNPEGTVNPGWTGVFG